MFYCEDNIEDFSAIDDNIETGGALSLEPNKNHDDLQTKLQIMSIAAYSITQLAESFEDQEIFRALRGISFLLKIINQAEDYDVPIPLLYNFLWALGVVITHNTPNQVEVSNNAELVTFFIKLAARSSFRLKRKAMLIMSALCEDQSLRVVIREQQVCFI